MKKDWKSALNGTLLECVVGFTDFTDETKNTIQIPSGTKFRHVSTGTDGRIGRCIFDGHDWYFRFNEDKVKWNYAN